jgi:hypothetical protein
MKVNGDKMAEASGENEKMKYGMIELNLFQRKNNSSHSIEKATCKKPNQSVQTNIFDQRPQIKDYQPAHGNIHDGREQIEPSDKKYF